MREQKPLISQGTFRQERIIKQTKNLSWLIQLKAVLQKTREEKRLIKISKDNLIIRLLTQETLVGQFSKRLRRLYLNELIDSTVLELYFVECTDKPNSQVKKIKLTSKNNASPFPYVFNCKQTIRFKDANKISLQNRIAFTLSKSAMGEKPSLDYYFDFEFSDEYEFALEFDKPTDIKNIALFNKTIKNAYFEVVCAIKKGNNTN